MSKEEIQGRLVIWKMETFTKQGVTNVSENEGVE